MNFFSDWFLSPSLIVEIQSQNDFSLELLNKKFEKISVLVISESYLASNLHQFQFSSSFVGVFNPKNIYPLNETGKNFFLVIPQNEPKKLNFENPGKAHIASHVGSIVSSSLVQLGNKFAFPIHFFIDLSSDIKELIGGEQSEFIVGLLQKSISNRVFKNSCETEKQKLKFVVNLNEEFFSRDNLQRAYAISDSMSYTRSFINMPPNILNPETYEIYMRHLVKNECEKNFHLNQIQMEIMDYNKLLQENCGLICAVGQGSQIKPRIIKLVYSSKRNIDKMIHVSLIGKGITFDTGGYDIKPSSGMRIMKKDMGGSAAALGIFFACLRLNLPLKLTCWLPLAENMISGAAMRPGDVYKSRNGLQIEIDNTDAEGRLILADAISLACEESPDWVIDLATLTGAARVSLGTMVDSLYGNSMETSQILYDAGIESGDWVWNMPLPTDYENYLESNISDLVNSGSSGFAGSITAALFLQKFISVKYWNHIDTYMWCDRSYGLWSESGCATGKCVRLVTRAIEKFISSKLKLL